jgi:hypothetical protein
MIRLRLYLFGLMVSVVALLAVVNDVRAADTGFIVTLVATSPSSTPCSSVEVTVQILATDTTVNTNLYLEIRDPVTNAVLRSTRLYPPAMNNGDTWNGNWSTDNCGFTAASPPDYTLNACWSSGLSNTHCNIASANTFFATVPTLEGIFGVFAAAMTALWIWSRRHQISVE